MLPEISSSNASSTVEERALGVSQSDEPQSFSGALKGAEEKKWRLAIDFELASLEKNKTWRPCVLHEDRNAFPLRWIFKTKLDVAGKVCRYKARLVCKRLMQREEVDYSETFAAVAMLASITLPIAIAASYKFRLVQLDVISAFHNPDVEENIYVQFPEGLIAPMHLQKNKHSQLPLRLK